MQAVKIPMSDNDLHLKLRDPNFDGRDAVLPGQLKPGWSSTAPELTTEGPDSEVRSKDNCGGPSDISHVWSVGTATPGLARGVGSPPSAIPISRHSLDLLSRAYACHVRGPVS